MHKLSIVVAVSVMSIVSACGPAPEGAGENTAAAPKVTASAKEISAAFQENEVKAKKAYGDRTLEVTGTIKDIELDFADKPVVKLKGANEQMNMGLNKDGKMTDVVVSGLPEDVTAELKKGDALTVVCASVTEIMGGAQLGDCSVASSAADVKK
jgi:hypothetical protein